MRNTILLAGAALIVILATIFPDERDEFLDSLFGSDDRPERVAAFADPPPQPLVCGDDFISFRAGGIIPGPVHLRRASVEKLSFTDFGVEITTTSGDWIVISQDMYASVTHCLILGPSGLDPSYQLCENSIVRPCLGPVVDTPANN